MRIIQLSQMIDANAPYDERLQGAVNRAIKGMPISDATDLYGVKTDDLSDALDDQKRLAGLPVQEILALRATVKNNQKPPPSEIAAKLGLKPIDVSWVIRTVKPDEVMRLIPEEQENILWLFDHGKTTRQIAKRTRIAIDAINEAIRNERGPRKADPNPARNASDQASNDYLAMLANGKTENEAIQEVLTRYPVLTRRSFLRMLRDRKFKNTAPPNRPYDFSEYLQAKELVIKNPSITVKELAALLKRPPHTLAQFLKTTDPRWYNQSFAPWSPQESSFISEMAYQQQITSFQAMAQRLHEKFGLQYNAESVSDFMRKYHPKWYAATKETKKGPLSTFIPSLAKAIQNGWPFAYAFDAIIPTDSPVRKLIDPGHEAKKMLAKMGIYANYNTVSLHPAFYDDIVEMSAKGVACSTIAGTFGITIGPVYKILKYKQEHPEPYAGNELTSPGQKEAYLKWWLATSQARNETKEKENLLGLFNLDFAPGSANSDAPTPNVKELFKQVGLPTLLPNLPPTTKSTPLNMPDQPQKDRVASTLNTGWDFRIN